MQLIIAEKPSVGAAIAAALGATGRKSGYIEGKGIIISWCIGHLVGLADAGSYDERFKKWRYDDLPILPDEWNYALSPGKEEQFAVLKSLMERPDISEVVNACDAGREGELIFRLVYETAGCTKPISRLWISSMEDTAIREGFQRLKPGAEYEALYQSALCRSKADWLIGINATRLFSVLYHKTLNVGRVQTPTLAMLVERDRKISSFIKEKYHLVRLELEGMEATSERVPDISEAERMKTACHERQAVCVSLNKEKKTVKPPKLFDLTTLQREANRTYGFTAKQTLDYAQSLYERKVITYPRTDSRYLTSDMADTAADILKLAAGLPPFDGAPAFSPDVAALLSDKDVSDHHAIIPTMEAMKTDLAARPVGERSLFFLICCKLLCAAGSPHVFEAITAVFECGGHNFTAKGKTVLAEGWKVFERLFRASLKEKPEDDSESESDLPELVQGRIYERPAASVTEHYTAPPKPYTEDTLLSTMEHAGKDDIPEDAERKGLGTPATRAAIIEKLVSSGFAERKGKSLAPTKDGINLITVLPEVLTSPLLTADWEQRLSKIAKGATDPSAFMEDIQKMATELVAAYSHISEDGQKLFAPQKEPVGACPRCGEQVYEGKKNFYCGNRSCGFVLWKNDHFWLSRKKELTKKMAADLLKKGRTKVKGMYSEKKGSAYDATVLLDDTGGKYVNFKLEFEKKREQAR
ncbi:DNA topoisomerase 3 [Oscillibacter sp.]|uniref:type IA DNA topoisomerase n=1 Tax=Oscillibacter sp. TaxID=1945593 RepID=UPI00289F1FD5|nr:DNA topoisomerase 3 [Oscillibacter sp.]